MKYTQYFLYTRKRPDRARIKYEWIELAIENPERTEIQSDGRVRKWVKMKIKYFSDTDTTLLEFSDNPVKETREISENVYLDLDADGNLVSMTIEHARTTAQLPDIAYQQIDKEPA